MNRIIIPEEYREFILKVGNGGEGPPFYGLYSLYESINATLKQNKDCKESLSKEFPFSEYWVWEDEGYTPIVKSKIKLAKQGNLILGEEGCGMYWTLIISGKDRGQIWNFADVGIQPCAPRLNFIEWYEYWLDGGSDWWRDFVMK